MAVNITGGLAVGPPITTPTPQAVGTQKAQQALTSDQDAFNLGQQKVGFDQNLSEFGDFFNKFFPSADGTSSSSSSSGSTGAPIGTGTGTGIGTWTPTPIAAATPPPVAAPTAADVTGQTFAQAKGRVADSLTGLMKALGDSYSARGIQGSSAEAAATGNTLLGGEKQLADSATTIAQDQANAEDAMATTGYNGAVTQRGQDVTATNDANSAALTARGQNLTAAEDDANRAQATTQARMAALTGLWSAFNKGNTSGVLY